MGQVCAKNDAGKVATDAPRPGGIKRSDRELTSSQAHTNAALETKFVSAEMNFNIDKGVEKKANDLAFETANQWCSDHPGWEYTGQWKNERN